LNVGLKADHPSAIDLPFVANLTAAQATIDVLTLEIRSVSGSDFIGVRFTGPAIRLFKAHATLELEDALARLARPELWDEETMGGIVLAVALTG
jgi:hypothetical protein